MEGRPNLIAKFHPVHNCLFIAKRRWGLDIKIFSNTITGFEKESDKWVQVASLVDNIISFYKYDHYSGSEWTPTAKQSTGSIIGQKLNAGHPPFLAYPGNTTDEEVEEEEEEEEEPTHDVTQEFNSQEEVEPVKETKFAICQQIFCSRTVNMEDIKAIGFKMEYTLINYKVTFENLAYVEAKKRLVNGKYPEKILEWNYNSEHMIRGLIIDKKKGNIIKVDHYNNVKMSYHGMNEMPYEESKNVYGSTFMFEEPEFAAMDTTFSCCEGYLFAQLVDLMDTNPQEVPAPTYMTLYKHLREAFDQGYKDGTLKQSVANDLARYIDKDPSLLPMLQNIKNKGISTFLITDSRSFFSEESHVELFDVEIETGKISNPKEYQLGRSKTNQAPKEIQKVYQGGDVGHLQRLLPNTNDPKQVLYVTHHITKEMLNNKAQGWKTMQIIPELEKELQIIREQGSIRQG
uniref:Uncharacterized protein n=1 Tax=Oryza rufipogon TaxID=4529 RepID=A0A0E0REL2_ORYRU